MTASIWAPNGFSPEIVPFDSIEGTATAGQTIINIAPYTALLDSQLQVFVGGQLLNTDAWDVAGSSVILATAMTLGKSFRVDIYAASPTAQDELPSQTGNAGKALFTDGTIPYWAAIPDELPSQTGNAGKFLYTDGTNPLWGVVITGSLTVNSIAELKALDKTSKSYAYVLGYYTPGDGGGGLYWLDATDTTSADNLGTIIVATDGGRWKLHRTWAVTIKQFGAKGIGIAYDDTPHILAAVTAVGPRELQWLRGDYTCNQEIVMPDNQSWTGTGGQRAVTLIKTGNCDMVNLGDLCSIRYMNFNGNGNAGYTGKGIKIVRGFSMTLDRVRVYDTWDEPFDRANNVGGSAQLTRVEFNTIDSRALIVAAFKERSSTATPMFVSGMWCSGGLIDIQSGGNGVFISNFYCRNILTNSSTALAHLQNGRVASLTDFTVMYGADNVYTNIAFSGTVSLNGTQGHRFPGCVFGGGIIENLSSCQYNSYDEQARVWASGTAQGSYWTNQSGANPTLGNGSLDINYTRNGFTVTVNLQLTMGSTTTYGNAASAWQIRLPFRAHLSYDVVGLAGTASDASANTTYPIYASIGANTDQIVFGYNTQTLRDTFPFAWAAGDKIFITFTYAVR